MSSQVNSVVIQDVVTSDHGTQSCVDFMDVFMRDNHTIVRVGGY